MGLKQDGLLHRANRRLRGLSFGEGEELGEGGGQSGAHWESGDAGGFNEEVQEGLGSDYHGL